MKQNAREREEIGTHNTSALWREMCTIECDNGFGTLDDSARSSPCNKATLEFVPFAEFDVCCCFGVGCLHTREEVRDLAELLVVGALRVPALDVCNVASACRRACSNPNIVERFQDGLGVAVQWNAYNLGKKLPWEEALPKRRDKKGQKITQAFSQNLCVSLQQREEPYTLDALMQGMCVGAV